MALASPAVDAEAVRAVIIRSAKPRSFVNGVGLLYAASLGDAEKAEALGAHIRETYAAVERCPVPTIAVVLRLNGLEPESGFGVAPSTLRHWARSGTASGI